MLLFVNLRLFAPVLAIMAVMAWGMAIKAADNAVVVPGTKVSLEPPTGFSPSSQFPGFMDEDTLASIMVTEIPAPYADISGSMTPGALEQGGMALLESSQTTISGREGLLLHVTQRAGGVQFEKWMALFGDDVQTVMVVGTYPQESAPTLSEPIRLAVLSSEWDLTRNPGLFDGLTFRIEETETLKFARRLSNMLLLTRNGQQGQVAPQDPFAVVGASISEVEIADLAAFSRQRLESTAQLENVSEVEGHQVTVDGMEAYELVANAVEGRSHTPLRVYQLVALHDRNYFLVQGFVGADQGDSFLTEFRQLGESLTHAE